MIFNYIYTGKGKVGNPIIEVIQNVLKEKKGGKINRTRKSMVRWKDGLKAILGIGYNNKKCQPDA